MHFDDKGNFVRHTESELRELAEKKQLAFENKCREYILHRLLKEPMEARTLWEELQPLYGEMARLMIRQMRSYGIIITEVISNGPKKKKVIHHLNTHNEYLTIPESRYYFPEIAKAVEAIIDEENKRRDTTAATKS